MGSGGDIMSESPGQAGAAAETPQVNPAVAVARGPYRGASGHGVGRGIPTREASDSHAGDRRASTFLPLLLVGLAVLGWTVFQTLELIGERHSLSGLQAAQQRQVLQSAHLRTSLNALASDTQRLADRGDAGAQVIVEQLKKRGITIHPGN